MTLRESLRTKDFVLTGHMNLAAATDAASLLRQADTLRLAVDAVQLPDNASLQPQMSGLAAAALLIPQGIHPIVHFACRDRNRIALQKDVFGAAALGVSSVLVMRGNEVPKTKLKTVQNVFDTPPKELLAFINGLKNDENPLISPDFFAGTNGVILDPGENWMPKNLTQKCDAGANFIQLQLCFDMEALRNYMARLVETQITHRTAILTALSPLPSADAARLMRDNVKGAMVPDSIIARLENAADQEREGIEICAELLQQMKSVPGVSGASLMSLGEPELIAAAIESSGLRD